MKWPAKKRSSNQPTSSDHFFIFFTCFSSHIFKLIHIIAKDEKSTSIWKPANTPALNSSLHLKKIKKLKWSGQALPPGRVLPLIYRIYIVGFWDLHLIQSLSIDLALPTLPCSFTDPPSFFYRPCLPPVFGLGDLGSSNEILYAVSVRSF